MILEQNARADVRKALKEGVIDIFAETAYDEAMAHGWDDDKEVELLRKMLQSKPM